MRILVDVDEAAERFEELIELALRRDEVLICRAGKPVAELSAIPRPVGNMDEVRALAADGRASSNQDDLYDEHVLPK